MPCDAATCAPRITDLRGQGQVIRLFVARNSGYMWQSSNSSKRDFARDEAGMRVAKNAVEGFFGRAKFLGG
eukprot:12434083-Alexandrium_andersonii.AAC.1